METLTHQLFSNFQEAGRKEKQRGGHVILSISHLLCTLSLFCTLSKIFTKALHAVLFKGEHYFVKLIYRYVLLKEIEDMSKRNFIFHWTVYNLTSNSFQDWSNALTNNPMSKCMIRLQTMRGNQNQHYDKGYSIKNDKI